jgi:hypothetical protein
LKYELKNELVTSCDTQKFIALKPSSLYISSLLFSCILRCGFLQCEQSRFKGFCIQNWFKVSLTHWFCIEIHVFYLPKIFSHLFMNLNAKSMSGRSFELNFGFKIFWTYSAPSTIEKWDPIPTSFHLPKSHDNRTGSKYVDPY